MSSRRDVTELQPEVITPPVRATRRSLRNASLYFSGFAQLGHNTSPHLFRLGYCYATVRQHIAASRSILTKPPRNADNGHRSECIWLKLRRRLHSRGVSDIADVVHQRWFCVAQSSALPALSACAALVERPMCASMPCYLYQSADDSTCTSRSSHLITKRHLRNLAALRRLLLFIV